MKVRPLADDSVAMEDLKKQFAARDTTMAVLEEFSANLNKSLELMTRSHGAFCMELDRLRPPLLKGHVIWDFTDSVCKAYSLLVSAQSTSYLDCLNIVRADARMKSEFLRGIYVSVSGNGL